jgi:methionyl-tRNA synthetase
MITTCDRCRWGKYPPNNIPGDKYEGQVFYYCEATRNLIREASALDTEETCPNFLPRGASCDNCDNAQGCPRRISTKNTTNVCAEWGLRA